VGIFLNATGSATVRIRTVQPSEYAALGDVLVQAYNSTPGSLADPDHDAELRLVAERASVVPVLAAVEGASVLGGLTFVPGPGPFSELAEPGEAEIRMFGVSPEVQGHGVGAALVRHVISRARKSNRQSLLLSTSPWMHAAQALYLGLGFTRAQERDWTTFTSCNRYDLLAYRLALGD
jgi:ribosomal protein S18 acetylase RimI-like enzyme